MMVRKSEFKDMTQGKGLEGMPDVPLEIFVGLQHCILAGLVEVRWFVVERRDGIEPSSAAKSGKYS